MPRENNGVPADRVAAQQPSAGNALGGQATTVGRNQEIMQWLDGKSEDKRTEIVDLVRFSMDKNNSAEEKNRKVNEWADRNSAEDVHNLFDMIHISEQVRARRTEAENREYDHAAELAEGADIKSPDWATAKVVLTTGAKMVADTASIPADFLKQVLQITEKDNPILFALLTLPATLSKIIEGMEKKDQAAAAKAKESAPAAPATPQATPSRPSSPSSDQAARIMTESGRS